MTKCLPEMICILTWWMTLDTMDSILMCRVRVVGVLCFVLKRVAVS